jgi:hypothetical protein
MACIGRRPFQCGEGRSRGAAGASNVKPRQHAGLGQCVACRGTKLPSRDGAATFVFRFVNFAADVKRLRWRKRRVALVLRLPPGNRARDCDGTCV